MTADPRVTAARQAIAEPGPRHDVLLPASVLTRMFYELRRQLGQVLDVIDGQAGPGSEHSASVSRNASAGRPDHRRSSSGRGLSTSASSTTPGTGAITVPSAGGLTAGQLGVLRQALGDAIARREPGGFCIDCDAHPAGLCEDHAEDLDRCDAYGLLAKALGVEL